MGRITTIALCALLPALALAQVHPLERLIDASRGGAASPGLADLVTKTLSPHGGTAVWGQDYLFVTDLALAPKSEPVSATQAGVSIDGQPPLAMEKIEGSNLWMRLVKMRIGCHARVSILCG